MTSSVLALDVGAKRIGVARANLEMRLAQPFTTLENNPDFLDELRGIIESEQAVVVVVGWPRGLDGQTTEQTKVVEAFVAELKLALMLPIYTQDEAVTSVAAEAELKSRGKLYSKGDIDSLAATYILEDFLSEHGDILDAVLKNPHQ